MSKHVCPWWLGYFLLNPFRRLYQNPHALLSPIVKAGMTVLDVGPGMGFFSLPMAGMVGPDGKVVCVDVQEKMLLALQRRAKAAAVAERIVTRICTSESLCLDDYKAKIDFALAFAVVHEVPHPERLFADLSRALKPGAFCLVAEPRGHVPSRNFENSLAIAHEHGLHRTGSPVITWSRAALLKKG